MDKEKAPLLANQHGLVANSEEDAWVPNPATQNATRTLCLPGIPCLCNVGAGNVGIVQECGRYAGEVQPGPVCISCPFQTLRQVDLRHVQMNCQSNTKTKDNVTVSLHTSVVYNISPDAVYEAIFTIQDPRGQINSLIDDVLRSSLPQLTLDEAFEAKEVIHK